MRARAYAKINLSLEVLGKRADGFHDLVSVMQTVSLADTIGVTAAPDVSLVCTDQRLQSPGNLVLRAAHQLRRRYAVTAGCHLDLDKHIPAAAGLGGGSSDAAATLTSLAHFWRLDTTCSDLVSLGAELGSDVPFFLYGGTALVEGRGEVVTPLPASPPCWYLLVKPPISVSTAAVFAALPATSWTDGAVTRKLAAGVRAGGAISFGVNALQDTLFRLFPKAADCFHAVEFLAPGRTMVTGSGPTVAAQFATREQALGARRQLRGLGYWMEVVQSCNERGRQTPCG